MIWEFDGDGRWTAFSLVTDDGSPFEWRIAVCDDGTFCVNESDSELTSRCETFDTLRDAKTWCEEQECLLAESLRKEYVMTDSERRQEAELERMMLHGE